MTCDSFLGRRGQTAQEIRCVGREEPHGRRTRPCVHVSTCSTRPGRQRSVPGLAFGQL